MNDYGHWAPRVECDTCYKTFRSQNAANQHMNRAGHWAPTFECDTCSKTFRSQNAANQHMNSTGHWGPRVECETCDSKFFTARDANRHMRAEFHFRDYCHLCDRSFQSNNGLRMVGLYVTTPSAGCTNASMRSISTLTFIVEGIYRVHSAAPTILPPVALPIIWRRLPVLMLRN
jgi:uncharacterized C2H2 Zn-finger protein